MKVDKATVLITGGATGLGLEFAKQLLECGATVIICSRNSKKLELAKVKYPKLITFKCDITNEEDVQSLHEKIISKYPELNLIINNAGIMHAIDICNPNADVTCEITTNLVGPVLMCHHFINHLMQKQEAAIVNVSSGLAHVAFANTPMYCTSKAGVHMFTKTIRKQLKKTSVNVIEVAPPKTTQPMYQNAEKTKFAMKPEAVVKAAINGIKKDKKAITPGASKIFKIVGKFS